MKADKKQKRLSRKGWKFDGIWYISPYTGIRYTLQLACDIEELRDWAEQDSAYLSDKGHAMWAFQENVDNKTLTQEEMKDQEDKLNQLRLLTGNVHISLPPAI